MGPEAPTDTVVRQRDPVRSAWLDAAKYASRLDGLVPVLQAAAELCGVSTAADEMLLPLVIDVTGLHRRRCWESWRSTGRCGRGRH